VTADAPRIWFEVGFLIDHFTSDLRSNGIQRVGLELLRSVRELDDVRIGLCRFVVRPGGTHLEPVDYSWLEAVCAGAAYIPKGWPRWKDWIRKTARNAVSLVVPKGPADRAGMAPGDILLMIGTDWSEAGIRAWVRTARAGRRIRFAAMIHDVIPFTHPRLVAPIFLRNFTRNFHETAALADTVLVSSQFTAAQIATVCQDRGWPTPRMARIHFGAGFVSADLPAAATTGAKLPESFVLFVSSIEGLRKNHIQLVRVWRKLLDRHGADTVPSLVFIGTGRLVDGVAAALRADPELREKVIAISDGSEELLREAYRNCLLTVYPSLVEGWGLPVAEALTFGKFCVASNRGSLPEVAGDLIDYFDPDDDDDALTLIERAIFDAAYRRARTARIAAEFHPPSWRDCASQLVAVLTREG